MNTAMNTTESSLAAFVRAQQFCRYPDIESLFGDPPEVPMLK